MNGLGQEMRLPAAHLYGRPFSYLAAMPAHEAPVYPNWGEVNSAMRESVRCRHSLIRLKQCLRAVLVEMNSRRQTPGDDLIEREKETQKFVWQVKQVGSLEQDHRPSPHEPSPRKAVHASTTFQVVHPIFCSRSLAWSTCS